MENFSFLKNDYPDLYLLCFDVAKYIDTDNSISMLKARQAIEFIVKYLGAETDDLFVNINNLEDKNIANSRIIDLFHLIRKKANKSVHNEINSDTEGVLDALMEICVWLAVGRDKKNISIIKFTDKEKFFLKKYGKYDTETFDEELDEVDTINPLEVVGKFSDEDIETTDVLEQDVFETYEEYCARIESLPPIKIGYAFLDPSQIDDYCEVAFPLFHVSKHPKIEAASVSAFYVSDIGKGKNIDGIIKAKLKILEEKIYYDYDSVTLQDDDNEINLYAVSWEKYGYETEEQFKERIKRVPLLPVGIAKPIRKEYDLQKQILPFETIPMAYVSKVFTQNKILGILNRDEAKEICLIKSPFKVYARFNTLQSVADLQLFNKEKECIIIIDEDRTVIKSYDLAKVDVYLALAEQGNANAQYELAEIYANGTETEIDVQKALEWYKKAAEQNSAKAQFKMGECYYYGEGTAKDEKAAFKWYKKAAKQGSIDAWLRITENYDGGLCTQKDAEMAFSSFKKAAEQGNVNAQYALGKCLKYGIGNDGDERESFKWLKKAAEQGNDKAQYELALSYDEWYGPEDEDELRISNQIKFKWYKKAAEQGHMNAQFNLAYCYYTGDGTKENKKKAFEWFKKVAERGEVVAQYNLGVCYFNGEGAKKDYKRAFEWYMKAAEQGYDDAIKSIGKFYSNGYGTEKDEQKAFEWYMKAAEQGNTDAQLIIAERYEAGLGIDQSEQKASEWYLKAAEQGCADAQLEIAERYEAGIGIDQSEQKASEWYLKAAEQGNAGAQLEIAKRYETGLGMDQNERKASEWYLKAAEQGDTDAQLEIAKRYEAGLGIGQSEQKAFEIYKILAEQDDVESQYKLAKCYSEGIGTDKFVHRAFGWYRRAADQGYAQAQFELAECYAKGLGIGKNAQKALEWYTKAAEQGNNEAKIKAEQVQIQIKLQLNEIFLKDEHENYTAEQLYNAGWSYENGIGVNPDKEYAKLLYAIAAQDGNSLAEARLHYLNSLDNQKF